MSLSSLLSGSATTHQSEISADLDTAIDLLSSRRRRHVIRFLADQPLGDPIRFGTVVEHVASVEQGVPVAQVDSDHRKSVYVTIYQCHLDEFHDHGVAEVDEHKRLTPTQETRAYAELLAAIEEFAGGESE